jgi:hypothetical protein
MFEKLFKLLFLNAVLILLFLCEVSVAYSQPCHQEGYIFHGRPYDKEYHLKFDSLYYCNTSTAEEINDFMHLALTDQKIDPQIVAEFIDFLSNRNPFENIMIMGPIDPRRFTTSEVLAKVSLQEKDVEPFLNCIAQEPRDNSDFWKTVDKEALVKKYSIEPRWNDYALLRTELGARKLLLPKEIADVLQELQFCKTGPVVPQLLTKEDLEFQKKECLKTEQTYNELLSNYKGNAQINRNLQQGRAVAEAFGKLLNQSLTNF